MEKISGILPANSRVTSVDLRNSGVARPGAPSFGRETGMSSPSRRKLELETAMRANSEFKNQLNIRNEEGDPKAAIVKRMSDSFFGKKSAPISEEIKLGLDADTDMNLDTVSDAYIESRNATRAQARIGENLDRPSGELNVKGHRELPDKVASSLNAVDFREAAKNPKAIANDKIQTPQEIEEASGDEPAMGRYLDVRV